MGRHLTERLRSITEDPEKSISQLNLMPEAERHQVLVEWNRTERDYPRDQCVHQLFEEQVERTPDAVAMVFEGSTFTYRELNSRANQLAHYLRSLGVGPDVLVGLCVERSLEMVVAALGTLKAGGAYVPLDPAFPLERLAFMMEDAAMPVLITQRRVAERVEKHAAQVVWLDEFAWQTDSENLLQLGSASSLAYVIYTSGSTGQPKGVEISHQALVNCLCHFQRTLDVRPHDGWLAVTTLSFDIAGLEIWLPLLTGARVIIATRAMAQDGRMLNQALMDTGATLLHATPATWRGLLDSGWQGNPQLQILCGGEAMPQELADRLAVLGSRAWNVYGPTETTIYSTSKQLAPQCIVTIGVPLANTRVYILDAHGQPVPIGVAGELFIGGDGVARGYRNRPDLMAERFIPDPFSNQSKARLYRTGDLARWRSDGNIEYLGRADQQVKIRGHRIELGEIEAVLGGHPEVMSCAVVTQDRGGGDKMLVAFLAGRNREPASVHALRQWLGEKLPDYMIPSRFVAVPALPMTPNGKVDRIALAKLEGVELAAGSDYVAPRNELECSLAEIWQAVLRRDRVGIQHKFFDLGGHSLLVVAICSQITRRLNVEVPLRWMFEHPTIERLARQIESQEGLSQNNRPIEKADRHQPLPMSFAQQRMWLLQQTLPDVATYNQPVAFRLSGRVDRERVRRALQVIVERHEVLRTALVQQGESLVQQVATAKEVALPWQEADLQRVSPSQKEAALKERLAEEGRRPFDLGQAPLWRVVWIKLAEDEHVLGITFHHSIVDEWTLRLFFQEWERLYAANGQTELAGLPELPLQYADYAAWQRQRLTGELLEQQRSYWREQLQELPPALELPTDMVRPVWPSGRGAVHNFQLTGPVVTRLRELAREEGTTLFTVLLAAFQVWLYRYTGQTDVIVGSPAANRGRPEVQALLGFFLNTLPIRVRLQENLSFREVVRQVRETVLGAFDHADLPFEQMVELAVKERVPGQQPLYQVMFVLLEEGLTALRLDQAQSQRVPMRTGTSKNDLILSIEDVGGTWDCQLEYATDLFTADSAARMGRHLTELLRSIMEAPEKSINQLNLMSAAERHQVLTEWNQTEREYPRDKCIHQLFEEQVERMPEAVAVMFEGDSLSYRELNARASQLALHLRSLGVGPGEFVGLRVERSFEMIIAVLGILKAGGAYWALEENLPEERLRLMLPEARPRVLLVRRKSVNPLRALTGTMSADSSAAPGTVAAIEDLLESSPGGTIPATPPNQAGDPAYVNYTSGSTGQPKGVVVPHRGVVRLVKGADYVSLNAEDTLLHLSPLSFDASTFEIWGALLNGGRVVLMPPGLPALAEIGEAIRRNGVTTLWLTAGLFHLMVDERLDDLKPLRQLLAGGDVLSPEHLIKACRALPDSRIVNGYGPTENTTFTCCYTVVDERELAPSVPIGRPIANTQVYVVDPYLQPVPVGVAGELYAGGDGVACGYLHQPELTAERFIPDPFSVVPGARLYRTGDCVRWRHGGNLEFLGRLDSQVKIRGYRVELGEVEMALCALPEVQQAAAVVREDIPGDKRLVAYLVAKAGEKPDAPTLRERLAQRLPEYMLPNAFVWLDQLPLTPNGKVDRKALPAPETGGGGAPKETSQPINLLELELIRIWRRLFQREDIGHHDNFVSLGGHSLMAARLAAEIEKLLGCKLPIPALFQSPTIESLARRLTEEDWVPPWSSLVPLQPLGSKPPLFFVHGWGGDVYTYLSLVKLLPPDQPSYGIQAVGLDGKSARHITVEDMAAHYVKEILSFQPDGPFYLAGYSMGGVIAFEVAQQLHRLGQRVALLALLDSSPTGPMSWAAYSQIMVAVIRDRYPFHLRRWREMPNRDRISYLRKRWVALQRLISRNRAKPPPVTAPPKEDCQPPQVPGFKDYYVAVASAYRVRRYPGTADVFISDDAAYSVSIWKYFARGGVSFHRIPGRHKEIITPDYTPALAKSLTTVLHRAQDNERPTARAQHTQAKLVS